MSTTVSSLTHLKPQTLASLLLSPSAPSRIAIIDVRDSDHIGGHIKSSSWVPAHEIDVRIPELLRLHKDKEKVVFHCMLSQQRGPSAALKFARAVRDKEEKERTDKGEEEGKKGPEVCVLEGGFGMWQARYGEDERLTEAYLKDLWD